MSNISIYEADRIFNGEEWLSDHAVVVKEGIIEDVVHTSAFALSDNVTKFPGNIIAPAFIDLQIYGAHKRLLAVYPEPDSLSKLVDYCRSGGAPYCMPTVATNTKDVFFRCIDAVKQYWEQGGEGILGLHIEGPWINPVKRGAHIESFVHSPAMEEVKELLAYGKGVIKIITLAPEMCSREIVEYIQQNDIIVSAGHSNATYLQATEAFNNGIVIATHLFNAMSPLQHREPGLVGAIFNCDNVMCSVIADGHHVDYAAIHVARKVMGNRLFAITDAVTETTVGPYQHNLVGDKYEAAGILSGSALTMVKACRNLVVEAGFTLEEALQLCSLHPAKVAHLGNELGKIAKGFKAKMVVMNQEMELTKLID